MNMIEHVFTFTASGVRDVRFAALLCTTTLVSRTESDRVAPAQLVVANAVLSEPVLSFTRPTNHAIAADPKLPEIVNAPYIFAPPLGC